MKKLFTLALATAVVMVGSLVAPKSAEAVPAFGRQVGVSCNSCHFQHIPKLNAFGRTFRLGGMTQAGVDLLEDDGLSIPATLNIGVIVKTRYISLINPDQPPSGQVKSGDYRGIWNMDDELAVFIGGRIGEKFGWITEGHEKDGGNTKFVYSSNFGGIQGGAFLFHTEGGPSYGMALTNQETRFTRSFESRKQTIPGHAMGGPVTGMAAGMGVFASNELFFVNFTLWGDPSMNMKKENCGGDPICEAMSEVTTHEFNAGFADMAKYLRVALTPKIGEGMDLAVGVQMTLGNMTGANPYMAYAEDMTVDTATTTVDFQLQMEDVGGMTLEATGSYHMIPKKADDSFMSYYGGADEDATGLNAGVSLGISASNGVKANYMSVTNLGGVKDANYSVIAVGGWHNFTQNIELVLEYAMYSYADEDKFGKGMDTGQMLLMLEIGI